MSHPAGLFERLAFGHKGRFAVLLINNQAITSVP